MSTSDQEGDRGEDLVGAAVEAVLDRKARDVMVLDMTEVSLIADRFLICSGGSRIQVQAIADGLQERLGRPRSREGYSEANWVCLDYGDLVAHVFSEDARAYYELERLWGDAPRLLDAEQARAVY